MCQKQLRLSHISPGRIHWLFKSRLFVYERIILRVSDSDMNSKRSVYPLQARNLIYKGQYSMYCVKEVNQLGTASWFSETCLELNPQQNCLPMLEYLKEKFYLQMELDHPRIVKNYTFAIENNVVKIVQELYTDILQNVMHTLTFTAKIQVAKQIAEALQYLKKQRVLHLDLRPTTIGILMDEHHPTKYQVKLIFSKELQRLEEDESECSVPIRKTVYSSPEIHNGETCTFKSDIWSFGCIFYEMVFGSLQGINVSDKSVDFSFPKNTPTWLAEIMMKMMAFRPKDRYSLEDVMNRLKFMEQCSEVASKSIPKHA